MKFSTFKQLATINAIIGIAIRAVSFVQYIVTLISAVIALSNPSVFSDLPLVPAMVNQIIVLTGFMLIGATIETIGFIYAFRWSRNLTQPGNARGTNLLLVFGVLGVATWLFNIIISGLGAALLPLIPMLPSLVLIAIALYTKQLASKNK